MTPLGRKVAILRVTELLHQLETLEKPSDLYLTFVHSLYVSSNSLQRSRLVRAVRTRVGPLSGVDSQMDSYTASARDLELTYPTSVRHTA